MTNRMTARLFVMTRFRDAYLKGRASARNKKRGNWTPDGWIPNTFWNGHDKAGNDGFAEQRRFEREFPGYFEHAKVQDLKREYGNAFYPGDAKIEAKRIKPEYRLPFTRFTDLEEKIWIEHCNAKRKEKQ